MVPELSALPPPVNTGVQNRRLLTRSSVVRFSPALSGTASQFPPGMSVAFKDARGTVFTNVLLGYVY